MRPLTDVRNWPPSGIQVVGQTFSDLDRFQFPFNWPRLRPPLFADGRFSPFA